MKTVKTIPASLKKTADTLAGIADILLIGLPDGNILVYCSRTGMPDENGCKKIYYQTEGLTSGSLYFNDQLFTFSVMREKIKEKEFVIIPLIRKSAVSCRGLLWESALAKDHPYFSPMVEKITGFSTDELTQKTGRGFSLLKSEDAEKLKTEINIFRLQAAVKELDLTYMIITKSGNELWVKEFILAERDASGNIVDSHSYISDLTPFILEKKTLEETLLNLQNLNRAKDQFISVLSHDLKSPYTSILGFSEILLNEGSLSPEERSEYLSYINLSSHKQLKLINNLLEWSRLVTGRKKPELCKLNLKNIINAAVSNNTRSILKKNLEVKISADNYIYVQADESLLTELMNIFISNAVKYSHQDKLVEIFINRFEHNHYEVIIKDEGTGISDKNKERLLKIDQVFSIPGTEGERGSGMSLLLANEIVRAHNGEMWFYSEEGKGTEFHFTLTASPNMILLIDNDETEKLKIKNMLRTNFPAFTLRTEKNSYDAFKLLRSEIPAFIITAHRLPMMNGIEFSKTLRKDDTFFMTPVIAFSEEINDKLKEEYKAAGVQEILSKPVDLKKLRDIIEENLK